MRGSTISASPCTDLDEAIATYERLFQRGSSIASRSATRASRPRRCSSARPRGARDADRRGHAGRRFLARRGPGMPPRPRDRRPAGDARRLESTGAQLIDQVPRQGLFGLEVAFVHPIPSTAFSRRWLRVADDFVRVEIGFAGGQILSAGSSPEHGGARAQARRHRDGHVGRAGGRSRSWPSGCSTRSATRASRGSASPAERRPWLSGSASSASPTPGRRRSSTR